MAEAVAGSSRAGPESQLGFDLRALGTGVRVVTTLPAAKLLAVAIVERELAAVDVACSRFREDSELSQLNRANGRPMEVSQLFLEALQAAVRAAELSDGLVVPTIGVAMREAGYDTDFDHIERVANLAGRSPRPVPGVGALKIDHLASKVRLAAGVEIDLGATAKALAADRAAAAVLRFTGSGVLVSLGGDLAIAGEAPHGGWPVHIAEDHAAPVGAAGETIHLTSGGLATSSTTVRRWVRGNEEMHHILDPATGLPARIHWRTATVGAGSCLDANIASTAAIVMGPAAPRWLEQRRLPARLVARNGRVHRIAGWPIPAMGEPR